MADEILTVLKLYTVRYLGSRSQWPRGLRRGSVVARLLGLQVRIPPGAWRPVCCDRRVLAGRGLCDGPIPRPEESYRVWCESLKSRNLIQDA